MPTHSVRFFETQFRRQLDGGDFALNPFERLALPYLKGDVLDLGCGLGNLAHNGGQGLRALGPVGAAGSPGGTGPA